MKKLFSFGVICLFMAAMATSCEKDDTAKGPTDGPESGEAFLSMKMTAPVTTSGVSRADYEQKGSEAERTVNNVAILLYDNTGANAILRYKFELEVTNLNFPGGWVVEFEGADVADGSHVDPTAVGQVNRFVSVGRKIKYQDYQMVVLVNYIGVGPSILARSEDEDPDIIKDRMIEDVSMLSEINDIFRGPDEFYRNASAGFFMSNANGIVPVPKTALQDTQEAAEANPVAVKVDRILAKTRIYTKFPDTYTAIYDDQGVTYINPAGVKIGTLTSGLNKTNYATYLIRQYADYAPTTAGGTGVMETYATSKDMDRKYIYATDVNFEDMRTADDETLSKFNTVTNYEYVKHWFARDSVYDGVYMLENTMELADQAHANYLNYTTHWVINAILAPKGLTLGEDYYSFINTQGEPKTFTHTEALEWLSDDKFPFDMTGLKAKLVAINGSPDVLDFNPSTTYPTGQTELVTEQGITYHVGGLNVYVIPLKHFQPTNAAITDAKAQLYGHYGVVRNNVYEVVIKSIEGPGTGGSGWLSADITVNDWYVRNQEEDL